ncbi:beta-defensin 125 [Ochotona princeps]|uniref:beta-defensin 125 n=1 Tax=Ochotona princeps TaxID=9978 RepID=UPI002714E786|nr:beta-defensin 125 [Ochotona princeps]
MNLLMLTCTICALLSQMAQAGWGVKKCWKNDVGFCRRRCLDDERYIRLCKNKLSCCISLKFSYDITRRPPPATINIEDITDVIDLDRSNFPVSMINDEVTFFGNPETMSAVQDISFPVTTPQLLGHLTNPANSTSQILPDTSHLRTNDETDG